MKILIDISEERFKDIQRISSVQLKDNYFKTAEQIIANGTPYEERPQGKWIPVSERLPDVDGGEYLVYRKTDAFIKRPFCIDIARWYSDDTENNGFNKYSEVIAWMPLPRKYKEAENEI